MIRCQGFGYQPEFTASHFETDIEKDKVIITEILDDAHNVKVRLLRTIGISFKKL